MAQFVVFRNTTPCGEETKWRLRVWWHAKFDYHDVTCNPLYSKYAKVACVHYFSTTQVKFDLLAKYGPNVWPIWAACGLNWSTWSKWLYLANYAFAQCNSATLCQTPVRFELAEMLCLHFPRQNADFYWPNVDQFLLRLARRVQCLQAHIELIHLVFGVDIFVGNIEY